MGKHKFQWPTTARIRSQHVFIVKIHYALANIFSWAKCNIFMGKVQHFHAQTELRVITAHVRAALPASIELLTMAEVGGTRKWFSSID